MTICANYLTIRLDAPLRQNDNVGQCRMARVFDEMRKAVIALDQEDPYQSDGTILERLEVHYPGKRLPDLRTVGRWRPGRVTPKQGGKREIQRFHREYPAKEVAEAVNSYLQWMRMRVQFPGGPPIPYRHYRREPGGYHKVIVDEIVALEKSAAVIQQRFEQALIEGNAEDAWGLLSQLTESLEAYTERMSL